VNSSLSLRSLFAILFILFAALLAASLLQAWTGPTSSPPNGNAPAPIYIGATSTTQTVAGLLNVYNLWVNNALGVTGGAVIGGNVSVNKTSAPVVALDVNGSIKIGNGGEECQAISAGVIRFNATSDRLEYCDGANWYAINATNEAVPTVIYLTSGTTWTVPSDWNSANNSIEVIGGGGSGGSDRSSYYRASSGGGGGAYSKTTDQAFTPNSTIRFSIGAGGAGAFAAAGNAGGDTYLCSDNTGNCSDVGGVFGSSVIVAAKGGSGGNIAGSPTVAGVSGGAASQGIGSLKYSGGSSGNGGGCDGSGGGGAAGPNGAGNNSSSTSGVCTQTNSAGGGGDAGDGGAGSAASSDAAGGNGTEWGTKGSGGGSGGNVDPNPGGVGGLYGGGSGGAVGDSNGATAISGNGAQGIIVITYAPAQ